MKPTQKVLPISLTMTLIFCAMAVGVAAGYLISNKKNQTENPSSIRQGGYDFINPLLECDTDGGLENKSLKKFEEPVKSYIDAAVASGAVRHVSVYFRDLNNGPWFGLNEDENFSPASLLKVPVMMTYYKLAESDPSLLNDKLVYEKQTDTSAESDLEIGNEYTIDKLISEMITESDNEAFTLLASHINSDLINKTLSDLGLTIVEESTPEDYISVRSYASLFRVLFNASYLSRDMSERALRLLSEVTYNEGIRKGLPESIVLSNKFGIRGGLDSAEKQLHDCGIVYYPAHPYLLCIMTRGDSIQNLSTSIGNISKIIYDDIDATYTEN